MTEESFVEDLKDLVNDIVAPEYHRLNLGVKYCLESLEPFVAAVVAAFLIPYMKKLGEKAADATWNTIFDKKKDRKKEESKHGVTKEDEPLLSEEFIRKATPEDRVAAEEVGATSVKKYLDEYDFPEEIKLKILNTIVNHLEEIALLKKVK